VIGRIVRGLLVAALLGQAGAHLVFAQSYAWARMAADRAKTAAMGTALAQTFDGRHPCGVCLKVQKDAQSKGDAQARAPERQFEMTAVAAPALSVPRRDSSALAFASAREIVSPRSIDTPPPQRLPA
jgi:hypothetical protein